MEETTPNPVTPTPAPTPAPAPAPAPEHKPTFDPKDIADNKVVAALSYLWILFLVPLLAKKDSPFAQFHAKQGLIICVAGFILSMIPVIGWLLNIVLFVVVIMALIKTLSGEAWEIPLVKDGVKMINL